MYKRELVIISVIQEIPLNCMYSCITRGETGSISPIGIRKLYLPTLLSLSPVEEVAVVEQRRVDLGLEVGGDRDRAVVDFLVLGPEKEAVRKKLGKKVLETSDKLFRGEAIFLKSFGKSFFSLSTFF